LSVTAQIKSLFCHGAIADFGDATTEYPSDGWWNGKCSSLDYHFELLASAAT